MAKAKQKQPKAPKPHPLPLAKMHPAYRAGFQTGELLKQTMALIESSMDKKTFVTGLQSSIRGQLHVLKEDKKRYLALLLKGA